MAYGNTKSKNKKKKLSPTQKIAARKKKKTTSKALPGTGLLRKAGKELEKRRTERERKLKEAVGY